MVARRRPGHIDKVRMVLWHTLLQETGEVLLQDCCDECRHLAVDPDPGRAELPSGRQFQIGTHFRDSQESPGLRGRRSDLVRLSSGLARTCQPGCRIVSGTLAKQEISQARPSRRKLERATSQGSDGV